MYTKLYCLLLSKEGYKAALDLNTKLAYSVIIFAPENLNLPQTVPYTNFKILLQNLYQENVPIVAFCSCAILIRILAPFVDKNKKAKAPILVCTANGGYCVPLLGANQGANMLAQKIARILSGQAVITTTGEGNFGINLHLPPKDLTLLNEKEAKSFITKILNGQHIHLKGYHDWFSKSQLPFDPHGRLKIIITNKQPLSYKKDTLYYLKTPLSGSLTIVGLGPGNKEYLTQKAQKALLSADDILGYHYYIDLAGPFLPHQIIHKSDNGEEAMRAQQALSLARKGRNVVLVSSGDPGIFAMAASVMQCLDDEKCIQTREENKHLNLMIEPGITAALAASSIFGAPLGHDFVMLSLSDNLKDWSIIEKRLKYAIDGDFVIAIYNPLSKKRQKNGLKLLNFLHQHCEPNRLICIATDIARPQETYHNTTVSHFKLSQITSRSVIIIGSSKTKSFERNSKDLLKKWIYTPRYT